MRHLSHGTILLVVLVFLTLVSLAAGGLYLWQTRQNPSPTPPPNRSTIPPSATVPSENVSPAPSVPPTSSAPTDETTNWKTYTSAKYGFSFRYPNEAKVEVLTEEDLKDKPLVHGVRVRYLGPDNRPQTEIGDGYFFFVNLIKKQPDSYLREIIADEIKACLDVGDLLSLQTPEEFYAKSGVWRYACQGLGIFVYNLMLDPTENNFYYDLITHATSPEETKEKAYQRTLNQILATFKFLN